MTVCKIRVELSRGEGAGAFRVGFRLILYETDFAFAGRLACLSRACFCSRVGDCRRFVVNAGSDAAVAANAASVAAASTAAATDSPPDYPDRDQFS